uniref:Proteasome (Prosome, macropain) subunit, beta type, 7 n=1 Tax=Schistosoma japonicum TaxID=6182 RepID=C1L7U8_SCHJA|nr:proteasome (prosome, macropain) subunit, beta type, 7 [Schistosoma japonicum]
MSSLVVDRRPGGFSFDNCYRNKVIEQKGFKVPKAVKTGTTICGVVFKNGIVLGADTRATEGNIVAEKNCSKIHRIADNMLLWGRDGS